MKRVISLISVMVLCFALAVPAFATEVEFVPSITAKPAPGMVSGSAEGETSGEDTAVTAVIEVKNENGEVVHSAPIVDLVITAVSEVHAEDEELVISEEAAEALKEAYAELNAEDAKLSELVPELVEQFAEMDLTAEHVDSLVVTDLFDVTILNEELEAYLNEEGHTIELTFEVNVPADHVVYVMVFKENKWQLIEETINNGDGTITCTFAHFCPVAILTAPAVEAEVEETEPAATEAAPEAEIEEPEAPAVTEAPAAPVEDAEGGFAWWWIILIVAAVVAIAAVSKKNKGAKKETEAKK